MFLLGSIFFCVNACNRMLHSYGGRVVMVWPTLGRKSMQKSGT